jgi:hypothetical protein
MSLNFEYRVEPDRRMVIVIPTGIPDFPSSIEAIRAVASDPAFGPDFGVLCDFSEIH